MAKCVFVYGKSGSGQSRSLLNFGEDEIFLVQTIDKELPFRKKFKYTLVSDNTDKIIKKLEAMPVQTAVIDDAGYLMTNSFMRGHSQPKSGDSSFALYNLIADKMWFLINAIRALPKEKIVYLVFHEDGDDYGGFRLRTIGKLLDQKVCLEGMVTIVLRCVTKDKKHIFLTQTDGTDITKTPEGMFESEEMPNDLKAVDTAIRQYYEI
jgi:hypothetical protein